jgi:hypothetical protein
MSLAALWIKWCKARARAHCWQEECILLEEEMDRVIQYFSWCAKWWKDIVECFVSMLVPEGTDEAVFCEGKHTYALRQAAIQGALQVHCTDAWDRLWDRLKKGECAALDIESLIK